MTFRREAATATEMLGLLQQARELFAWWHEIPTSEERAQRLLLHWWARGLDRREVLGDARQRYIEKLLGALSFMHADDVTRENAHSLVDELWDLMLEVKARGVEA